VTTLTHGDGQDLLAAFKRGWEKRDPDTILALFARNAEYRDEPFEEPLSGSNAIRALWNEICARQAHIEVDAERIWVSGRSVLASFHAAYTLRATAERRRVRGFMTFELDEDGLVERYRCWPAERAVGTDSTLAPELGSASDASMEVGAADGR
jgi:ketosteroid isomerase-like protein